ncbi:MAG TPA: CapA family protein [Deltaproteobacteria bacterium]|nr:CapA family protein [Deltaproteobacteria bacterium]HOI05595.1 CapA family protein [Deltaproteobacteria bacterium]
MKWFGRLSLIALALIAVGILYAAYSRTGSGTDNQAKTSLAAAGAAASPVTTAPRSADAVTAPGAAAPGSNSITMVFTGDVMLAGSVDVIVKTAGMGDYTYPWQKVADYLARADVAVINLESVISDKGYQNYYVSRPRNRASPLAMNGLLRAGIDVVSLANDHALDYNRTALADCITRLRTAGMTCIGAGLTYDEAYLPAYRTVKGKKIAFLAFTNKLGSSWKAANAYFTARGNPRDAKAGIAYLTAKEMEAGILKAREDKADFIVVSLHMGTYYSATPTNDQDGFAHFAMDRGAHLVIEHGSHVAQPTVLYANGCIAYSLGNFIYDHVDSPPSRVGLTKGKVLEVVLDENAQLVNAEELPVTIDPSVWQPSFD